ncbi:C40 family peptidase [Flavilitoribacter nigricans]|uniref:Glycoside hydrolase n=1 Tax=Flavilitoribacter nigricans (strain ATCC 23147 / DSM 23189 / NBRC 102662 / NCIMB 1420 / SS-2) TaxID=1122177 RepID=A0A2D0NAM1_FLAN2|nr:C40 family peptidase [Flavilitoribacter nigricans]PHN05554.1 glycoside hydrolase [Flavilitoribacter nigricans DSM 23189 = NBRC 102662]
MRMSTFKYSGINLLVLTLPLVFTACMERTIPQPIKAALTEIQKTYAPDRRVAIFDVKSHSRNDTVFLEGETSLPEAYAAVVQMLDQKGVVYVNKVQLLPDPALPSRGVVNVSVANIRSNPKHSGELSTQALLGMGLKVYKQEGSFSYVQTPDGYLGWMDSGSFVLMDDQAYQEWITAEKVIFTQDYGFVQDAAADQSGRVGDLVAGNILLNEGENGAYRAVAFPDGRRGFVPEEQISGQTPWLETKHDLRIPQIVGTALSMMGRPYLWGGTSGKGMDCSGFTKTVYFLNGFVLPRDASQQVHAGVDVPTDTTFNALRTGDFLFFGERTDDDQEKVRHVGIYLGEGQFIHSGADNPGVKIESLLPDSPNFAAHRRETFLRARRMEVGSPGVLSIEDLPDFFGPMPAHQLIQ